MGINHSGRIIWSVEKIKEKGVHHNHPHSEHLTIKLPPYLSILHSQPSHTHPPLNQQPRRRIRIQKLIRIQIRRTPLPLRILEIIPQDQMRDNHLELHGREETARAGVFAAAEVQVVFVCHGELVLVVFAGLFARVVVPETGEGLRVGDVGGVLGYGVGGGADVGAGGEVEAVGEC